MPRKSQALRIEQTQALIAAYQAAGINGTPLRFMVDMERAMARGKYPSKRQRDWLDKLIDEGVPKPVEPPKRPTFDESTIFDLLAALDESLGTKLNTLIRMQEENAKRLETLEKRFDEMGETSKANLMTELMKVASKADLHLNLGSILPEPTK